MKRKLFIALLVLVATISCNGGGKNFSKVEPGMSAEKVVKLVGEPESKTNLLFYEVWLYEDHVIAFNSDKEVVERVPRAEWDDAKDELDEAKEDLGEQMENFGKQLDSLSNEIKDLF